MLELLFALSCFVPAHDRPGPVEVAGASMLVRAPAATEAPVDPGRLRVRLAEGSGAEALRSALDSNGLAASRVVASGAGYEVVLDAPLADEAAVRGAVRSLASDARLAFVAPVLVGALGASGSPLPGMIVRLEPAAREGGVDPILALLPGARIEAREFAGLDGAFALELPVRDGFEVLDAVRRVQLDPGAAWAEPRMRFSGGGAGAPTDPLFGDQWGFTNTGQDLGFGPGVAGFDLDLTEAHELEQGDAAVGILVIDVGVDDAHPDLVLAGGTDLMTGSPVGAPGSPQNVFDNHGTPVAGVCSAQRDNGVGIAGAAPDCPLYSARTFVTLDSTGSWDTFVGNTALALAFAETSGVRVTVNSNYYGFTDASLEDKYLETRDAGMVHFVAAGNFSSFGVTYPATLDTVFAIGGTDEFATSYGFTSIGDEVDFAAPAFDVMTADRAGFDGYFSGDFGFVEGTSFAAPFAGGIAALCLSLDPSLTADEVGAIFRASTNDVVSDGVNTFEGQDVLTGYGQLDALAAAQLAAGTVTRLVSDAEPISVWEGGAQTLRIEAPDAPNSFYLMLGSVSGTSPGLFLPGIGTLPLNPDAYFDLTLSNPNSLLLSAGFGALDANGEAEVVASAPSLAPGLAGLELQHAAFVFDVVPILTFPVPPTNARPVLVSDRATATFAPGGTPIPDGSAVGIAVPFSFSGLGSAVTQVNVSVDIETSYYGDLELVLTSPEGTTVLVNAADSSADFTNMKAVFGGYFATSQSMSLFDGEDPDGTWTLTIADVFSGDLAFLNSCGLTVSSQ